MKVVITAAQHARETVCAALALAVDGHFEDAATVVNIHLDVTRELPGGVKAARLRLVKAAAEVMSELGFSSDEFRRMAVGLNPYLGEVDDDDE